MRNTADRFRFQTLQSKFATFCELWERQLNKQEVGSRGAAARSSSRAVRAPAEDARSPRRQRQEAEADNETADRVVQVAQLQRSERQADRVKELYERLAEAKKATGEAPIPFDRVAALVKAQVEKLGADGQEVAFRVAMKDGKVQLTVKTGEGRRISRGD